MRSIVIGFGLLIVCLLILFRIAEVNFIQGNIKLEIIVAIAAVIFFFVGLYFNNRQMGKPSAEKSASSSISYEEIKKAGLSQREHEVLVKMAEGLSNQEIAKSLFHSSCPCNT